MGCAVAQLCACVPAVHGRGGKWGSTGRCAPAWPLLWSWDRAAGAEGDPPSRPLPRPHPALQHGDPDVRLCHPGGSALRPASQYRALWLHLCDIAERQRAAHGAWAAGSCSRVRSMAVPSDLPSCRPQTPTVNGQSPAGRSGDTALALPRACRLWTASRWWQASTWSPPSRATVSNA